MANTAAAHRALASCAIGIFFASAGLGCGSDPTVRADAAPAGRCISGDSLGVDVGQIVPDIMIARCDGSSVGLHELVCGNPVTLIDIGSAAFASCVAETDAYATGAQYDALQARGLQLIQIFVGDDSNLTPTTAFCEQYSAAHAVDFEFLIDQLRNTSLVTEQFPFNYVVDESGQILHKWQVDIPAEKIQILDGLLPES